jgi:hypothetical protein
MTITPQIINQFFYLLYITRLPISHDIASSDAVCPTIYFPAFHTPEPQPRKTAHRHQYTRANLYRQHSKVEDQTSDATTIFMGFCLCKSVAINDKDGHVCIKTPIFYKISS